MASEKGFYAKLNYRFLSMTFISISIITFKPTPYFNILPKHSIRYLIAPATDTSHLNIHPAVLIGIQKVLNNCSQSALVNDQLSNFIPVTSGVPRGSGAWPFVISNIYYDLPTNLTWNIRMLADDCVLYRNVTNVSDQIRLHCDLNRVQRCCKHLQMEPNYNQWKLMSFQRRLNPLTNSYIIFNSNVQLFQSSKYLGLTLCTDLTWTEHIRTIIAAANRTCGFLKRHLRNAHRIAHCNAMRITSHWPYLSS